MPPPEVSLPGLVAAAHRWTTLANVPRTEIRLCPGSGSDFRTGTDPHG